MNAERTIVETSLEVIEHIMSHCGIDDARGFRSRARAGLSIVYQGLALSIAVIAARSSARALEQGLMCVEPKTFIERLCKDSNYAREVNVDNAEKRSYALYGYALLFTLKKLGLTKACNLAEFVKESFDNRLLELYAIQVAIWLKRFAEAYIRAD